MPRSLALALITLAPVLVCQEEVNPKELGSVAFARDLDAVLKSNPKKPVLVVFQEIPG